MMNSTFSLERGFENCVIFYILEGSGKWEVGNGKWEKRKRGKKSIVLKSADAIIITLALSLANRIDFIVE